MNPVAKARGLQLPRYDKGAASGRMTAARQNWSSATSAPSGADVKQFMPATLPASNPANVRLGRCGCASHSLHSEMECLSIQAVYHTHGERR